jgi:hypothetical protein
VPPRVQITQPASRHTAPQGGVFFLCKNV